MEPTIYKPSIYNGAGIYKTGAGGGGGGDLPEGYKRLTHIEIKSIDSQSSFNFSSISNLSIDDKYFLNFDLKTKAENSVILHLFSVRQDLSSAFSAHIYRGSNYQTIEIDKRIGSPNNYNIVDGLLEVQFLTKDSATINGTTYSNLKYANITNANLSEFLENENNLSILDGSKFFSFEIYDIDDNLKTRIIPVLNIEQNKPYLYDTVSQTFAYNINWKKGVII